jgi:hypothetical protein
VVLLTDVWSHQLGAHGAGNLADQSRVELKCYAEASLQPMTQVVARAFRLGSEDHPLRGTPAWLEPALPGAAPAAVQLAGSNAASPRD